MSHKLNSVITLLDKIIESANVRSAHNGKCFVEILILLQMHGNEDLKETANEVFKMACNEELTDFALGYNLEVLKNGIKEYIKSQMNKLGFNQGNWGEF